MLFYKKQTENSLWAIWKIDETKDELLSMLDKKDLVEDILQLKAESKIIERLTIRVLLKQLLGYETQIYYIASGKPYLKNTDKNISISHTHGYVAVMLSNHTYTGIDIQQITNKVSRVRSRFVSDNEYIDPQNELIHLLLHWSAKESLYKALGISGVNIKKDFNIIAFDIEREGEFTIKETLTKNKSIFNIYYFLTSDFVLTYISKQVF